MVQDSICTHHNAKKPLCGLLAQIRDHKRYPIADFGGCACHNIRQENNTQPLLLGLQRLHHEHVSWQQHMPHVTTDLYAGPTTPLSG